MIYLVKPFLDNVLTKTGDSSPKIYKALLIRYLVKGILATSAQTTKQEFWFTQKSICPFREHFVDFARI